MQIIEISNIDSMNQHEYDSPIGVGVDFGTTNSIIAFSTGQVVTIIPDDKSLEIIPSIISFNKEQFIIGDIKGITLYSIKRLFGKKLSEVQANPVLFALVKNYIDANSEILRLKIADKLMSVPEIAAQLFLYLKKQATRKLNSPVNKVVITIPAHFNDAARGEVMLAAKIAGFKVLRLIAEPTAAAYAYGFNKKNLGYYLVYDLGGGTFDVSILNMHTGVLQVIATGGDNNLGGDDIDYLVMKYFCNKYQLTAGRELIKLAKKAKEILSIQDKFTDMFAEKILELNRKEFELLILPFVQQTINITNDTLQHTENANITGIILVGGSTRIPLIRKSLEQTFNTPIFSDIDPDKAVVWGAALQAENLTSANVNSLLIDVVPLSLGLELNGGITEKLILRNTPIPISVTKEFTTYVDNQRFMKFHVVQGEREMVADCRSLAKFELELPLMKAGGVRIEVTFSIDADGILSVAALEKKNGTSHIISVKPSYGLSEEEVNTILEKAYKSAEEDHNKKLLQETLIEAQSLIYNVENAIKEISKPIKKEKIAKIYHEMQVLKEALKSNDRDFIKVNTKNFEIVIEPLIMNRLNNVVEELLKGKHIKDI